MLTNEDIHMIKALLYASKQLPDIPYPPTAYGNQIDVLVKQYLDHVAPTKYVVDQK